MALTNEDCERIERALDSSDFVMVYLKIDDREITLRWALKTRFERMVAILVEGKMESEWAEGNSPESKYWRSTTGFAYSAKDRKTMKRMSKASLKRRGLNPNERVNYYSPYFTSYKTLLAHLKSFEDATLTEVGFIS
ncbi:hypothetical protein [Maridesulfovibrio sp.]|uniref:hypothetical protein n=1 Tax=Maridesulfovibrio sp. TaxID=2795000 RepID=UPI002AA697D4|nr:hypothetical protein [Maridesulfovibrio sp.]